MNNNSNRITVFDIVVNGESFDPYLFLDEDYAIRRAKELSSIYGIVVSVYYTSKYNYLDDNVDDEDLDWSLIYEADDGEDVPQNETRESRY